VRGGPRSRWSEMSPEEQRERVVALCAMLQALGKRCHVKLAQLNDEAFSRA